MVAPTRSDVAPTRVLAEPIVFERSKKSGSKKNRKPRMKDADKTQRYLYKVARRTVGAADRGLSRYDKARRSSARRRRDGAIIEIVPNIAQGMAAGSKRLAPLPLDLARAGSARQITRRSVRAATRMLNEF